MVVLTDTHFTDDNTTIVFDIFEQAFQLALKRNKTVLHLGDWFTHRTGQTLTTLLAMSYVLNQAKKHGINIITIPGNHDKTDLESSRSYLDVFSQSSNLILIPEYGLIEYGKVKLHFLPYFPESGSYLDRLGGLSAKVKGKNNILLTHTTLNGAANNDGTKQKNLLVRERFSAYSMVLSGHFHNRSSPWQGAQYIGSPRPTNFGEDNAKGFTIINEDGSVKFVPGKFRQYLSYEFDVEVVNDVFEYNYTEAASKAQEGHAVRAVLYGGEEALKSFDVSLFTDFNIDVVRRDKKLVASLADEGEGLRVNYTNAELRRAFGEYCRAASIKGINFTKGLKLLQDVGI